jgi:hypothetical protein
MLGNLITKYINDNWVQPMVTLYDTTYIDLASLSTIYGHEYQEQYVYFILRQDNFDYLFVYTDGIHDNLSDEFFDNVRQYGIITVAYHADDEPNYWYNRNKQFDHRYDYVASHSKRGTELRWQNGWENRAIYLPWGYNPKLCYKITNAEKIYDVVYIGANNVDGDNYYLDGYQRQLVLTKLYYFCQRNNLNFGLFGYGWEKHAVLKDCHQGLISQEEMIRVYNQSKVIFNCGYTADGDSYQTKLRHFEVAGCGAFQIVNDNPELKELFLEDSELVFYSDENDLFSKILYYISHDSEREEIANKIYQKALQLHTTEERIFKLFTGILRIPLIKYNSISVKQLKINSFDELRKIVQNDDDYKGYDLIQIIAGEAKLEYTNYSLLKHIINDNNYDVFGIRTYFQLSEINFLLLHRIKGQLKGIIIKEKDYNYNSNMDYFENEIIFFEDSNFSFPLFNYLVRPNKFKDFLKFLLSDNGFGFFEMRMLETGYIVNHVVTSVPKEYDVPYIKMLRKLLQKIESTHQTIMFYGAKGQMAENVLKLLRYFQRLKVLGFIDKCLAGSSVNGYPIYSKEQIIDLQPDVVIITAEYSGAKIYQEIAALHLQAAFVPLYDLNNPIWDIMV